MDALEYELGLKDFCEILEATVSDRNKLVSLLYGIVEPTVVLKDAGLEFDPVVHYEYGYICGQEKIVAMSIKYPHLKVKIKLREEAIREAEAKIKSKKR